MSEQLNKGHFEGAIHLRQIRITDYDDLVNLQGKCFPGMKPWVKEQIQSQLEIFPEGQQCIEFQAAVIGSSSSLVIDFDSYGEKHNWRDIADAGFIRNHNPDGETLYGIEIMVDPEYQGRGLARRLYDARKQLAIERNLKQIILGGRIPGYAEHSATLSAEEYIAKVIQKDIFDPVLTVQFSNGFSLKRLLPAYMTSDKESQGYATLLEWHNPHFRPK
ncbi:MAG: GNAT family N-acetyltransferase [Bacteroidota bacterium]